MKNENRLLYYKVKKNSKISQSKLLKIEPFIEKQISGKLD